VIRFDDIEFSYDGTTPAIVIPSLSDVFGQIPGTEAPAPAATAEPAVAEASAAPTANAEVAEMVDGEARPA